MSKKGENIIEWNPNKQEMTKFKKGLDINEELDENVFVPAHIKRERELRAMDASERRLAKLAANKYKVSDTQKAANFEERKEK